LEAGPTPVDDTTVEPLHTTQRLFVAEWAAARAAWETTDPALHAATPLEPVERLMAAMPSPFAALANSIMHQQVSTAAGRAIARRFVATCGGAWDPHAVVSLSDEELRAAGLSGSKVRYMRALAEAAVGVGLDGLEREPDADIIARLVPLPGIGVWTVKMFMLFHLRRPDIFSGDDLGLREGLRVLDQLPAQPTSKAAEARAEVWSPYRSVASLALWDLLRRSRLGLT